MSHDGPKWLSTERTGSDLLRQFDAPRDAAFGADHKFGKSKRGPQTGTPQSQFENFLDNAPIAYFLHDANNRVLKLNVRAMALFGLKTFDENVNLNSLVCETSIDLLDYHLRRVTTHDHTSSVELVLKNRTDKPIIVLVETSILDSGVFQTVMVDVSTQRESERERSEFEAKMQQSQKFEILYQLSGGIAHDFNNLLQVLDIQSGIAQQIIGDQNQPLQNAVNEISKSIERGSQLTRRLLAFSRKAPLEKQRIDLNKILENSIFIIEPAIGKTVKITVRSSDDPLGVWVDHVQIEQLLVNLCLNSRDAISGKGTLSIEASAVELDTPVTKSGLDLFVGRYAKLTISDNGSGIPETIRDNIFEPFFTTKETGKGTGLGLSIVHNVLRQHEGAIEVVETSEKGTTIAVYLPRFRLNSSLSEQTPVAPRPEGLNMQRFNVALVVDDESAIRLALSRMLESAGVAVLTAANGAEAMELIDEHKEIELVVSDLVMPLKGGLEVCEHYRRTNSRGTVVLISGHGDSVLDQDYLFRNDAGFLQKPFGLADLENKIGATGHFTAT